VRAVNPKTQVITTYAGNGDSEATTSGNPGDGQPATSVIVSAHGVALGPDGSVHVTTRTAPTPASPRATSTRSAR